MTPTTRTTLSAITGAAILIAAGCVTNSADQGSDAAIVFGLYNGDWVLDADATGDRFRSGGLQTSREDTSRGMTTRTMRGLLDAAAVRPERFTLEVTDAIFSISESVPGPSFVLPMDGGHGKVVQREGQPTLTARVTWRDGIPSVERTFRGGGWISDRYERTAESRLIITRTFGLGATPAQGSRQLVYTLSAPPS